MHATLPTIFPPSFRYGFPPHRLNSLAKGARVGRHGVDMRNNGQSVSRNPQLLTWVDAIADFATLTLHWLEAESTARIEVSS